MFKKKTLGIKPKSRSLEEINKDYNDHAIHAGHKQRVLKEIQREVDHHVQRMLEINHEAKSIPPEATPGAAHDAVAKDGAR